MRMYQTEWDNRVKVCKQRQQSPCPQQIYFFPFPDLFQEYEYVEEWPRRDESVEYAILKRRKKGNLYGKAKWK